MCGIAGFWDLAGRTSKERLERIVGRMAGSLRHRGPDGTGVWADAEAGVALGHRRLAILDLSPTGQQPMLSHCGRFTVIFNGEIYNFHELRKELESLGHGFRGSSDTEIMLTAVSQWGLEAALKRFVGMFAFGLWDQRERVLHLVRDRMGEKPLYYGWSDGVFLFGSELKALRAHPRWKTEIHPGALALPCSPCSSTPPIRPSAPAHIRRSRRSANFDRQRARRESCPAA